ncbi:MAG: hypothetical protein M3Z02_02575 [Actinomycetota bacterium]|nr:hypothetical protein [Actinomycetota bacterium]
MKRRMVRPNLRDDSGMGMITVILVIAVMTALTITATALTLNNVGNSRRDRQALAAIATSEAGVAQAIQHLRSGNLAALSCTEPAAGAAPGASCQGAGPSWTSFTNPMQVRVDGGTGACVTSSDCFKVWIGTVAPFVPNCSARHASPPGQCYGKYRVHSTGISGNGPGARRLAVDVQVAPYSFPLGVFSEQGFSGRGNVGIHAESIFTGGCMQNRQDDSRAGSGTQFQWDAANNRPVIDVFYDQPAAAHSVGNISTSNVSCGSGGGGGPIHAAGPCNSTFKYDQDGEATSGVLASNTSCYHAYTRSDGTFYPTKSSFNAQDLQDVGYRPRGLTDAQYDSLKAQAQAEGTYNIAVGGVSAALSGLVNAGVSSPVLYWDNAAVSLSSSDFPASFLRNINASAACAQNSVTIVVSGPGHDLSYQGGNSAPYLVAAIFVPDGTLTGRGGQNTIGTVFAKSVNLGGNIDFYLDNCFASNVPGGTLNVEVTGFREDDSTDVN